MAGARALPDVKGRVVMDTTGLKVAEAEAKAASTSMGVGFGKASNSAQLFSKDLKGLERDTAKVIPGMGGMGSSMMGLPAPALAAAAAIGGLVIVGKSFIDISDQWEAAQKGLEQATDSIHGSYAGAQQEVKDFINTNKRYVSSQSEVVDAYAALLRQGLGTTKAQEDLNLALDLSKLKHVSLVEATTLLQQAEMGRGRALIPLGIQMKEFPVLMESQHQADVKLEAAEKAVEKATLAHTAAVKAHGPHSAQAQASAKALADANVKLAEAHHYAAERAAASAEVHDLLHQKLDGGRKSTSDLEQSQNRLSNAWQDLSQKVGPPLLEFLGKVVGQFADMVGFIEDVIGKIGDLISWLSKIDVSKIPVLGGIVAGAGQRATPAGTHVGRRAGGGAVLPNSIYSVGETGPETLVMGPGGSGGMVIPGNGSLPGGGSGGATVNVTVMGSVVTERQLTMAIREGIRRLDRAQT